MIAKLLIETDLENGQEGLAISPKSWRHIADIALAYRRYGIGVSAKR